MVIKKGIYNLTFITNLTLEPFIDRKLRNQFKDMTLKVNTQYISYNEIELEDNHGKIKNSDYIIVWLNLEKIIKNHFDILTRNYTNHNHMLDELTLFSEQIMNCISTRTNCGMIWISFEDYYINDYPVLGRTFEGCYWIDRLNVRLFDKLTKIKNFISMIDMKSICSSIGLKSVFSRRNKLHFNNPYTLEVNQMCVDEFIKQILIDNGHTKKCLVLDCDNVLWGGIISEEGIQNIRLGEVGDGIVFKDFQRFLLKMHNLGILLAISSKNDKEDVIEVFQNHPEMIIKEEHIAYFEVNWNPKNESIITIANQLNISLDSMVFIDDSSFEVESIKECLPQVTSLLFDDLIYNKLEILNLSLNINYPEIAKRHNTFRTNVVRNNLKANCLDYDDYLKRLETRIDILPFKDTDLNRIVELSQRTNKCTIGKRYLISDIHRILENNDYVLYSIYVSDRFGDLGMVGAVGIQCEKKILDMMCLSCRALGRKVEDYMIDYIKNNHKIDICYITPTKSNSSFIKKIEKSFQVELKDEYDY